MAHVITTITEHHYIYANSDDPDYAIELRYYADDTKACVYDADGKYLGDWKMPLDAVTYDIESHASDIIALFTKNAKAEEAHS